VLNETKGEKFGCLEDFSHLNGREKQYVIVGDKPDARVATFLFRIRVENNWPSQWHSRYKDGYIRFENRRILDLRNQTIGGKKVFLFPDTPQIYIPWLRQTLENKIKASVDKMAAKDNFAATQLIRKFIDSAIHSHSIGQHQVLELLPALSVCQLEELAERVAVPQDGQTGAASPPAA
jgi:predicted DNA-binding ribbon-helix-helix protein